MDMTQIRLCAKLHKPPFRICKLIWLWGSRPALETYEQGRAPRLACQRTVTVDGKEENVPGDASQHRHQTAEKSFRLGRQPEVEEGSERSCQNASNGGQQERLSAVWQVRIRGDGRDDTVGQRTRPRNGK
eukprot:scpid78007/ scgid19358/ 